MIFIFCSLICFSWIILSIIKQVRPLSFNRKNDPFALIPIWTLFSPRPMKNNCILGFRDYKKNNEVSDITIISNYVPSLYNAFWYGQRRDVKFILGLRKQILKYRHVPSLFRESNSFNIIKEFVDKNYNREECIARQIIYFQRKGWKLKAKDEILFVSNI